MKNGNIVLTSVLLLLFLHKSCECEKTFPTYSVTPSQNTFPLCPNYNGSFMASSPMLWTGLFAGLTVQLRNESCSMDCFDVLLNTTYCGIRVKVSEDSGVTLTSGNYSTWVAFANASEVSFLGNCSFEKMLQHIRNNFVARYNCSLSSANLPKVCSLRSRCVVNTKGYAFIWDRPYEFMISSSQPVSPGRYGPYTMVGEGAMEDFYETEFYKRRYYYREEMANLGAKRNATHWYWANTFLDSVEGKAFWDITANVSVNNVYTNWAPGEPRYDSNDSQKVVIDSTFGRWYVYPVEDRRYTYYKVTMMPEVTDALVLDQNITVILGQNVTVNITESSSPLPTPNTPPSRNNSGGGRNNSRSGGGSLPSKELATSITVIASVANYASLSPSTSLMAQRSMLVYRLMLCRLQDLKGLDDFSHPSSVEIEQDQYKGALVVNFGFVTFLFLFHVAYYKTRGEITPESKAAASRFPSHSIRAAVFFVQSICVTTFYILAQPQYPTVWKFVAAVLFLVYFGFLIWAFLRAMNKFHAIFVVSSNDVPPEFFVSKVIWHLTWSKGEWKDQPEYPGFHFQCGVLYNGFVPSRKWYLAVEVSGVIVLSLIASLGPGVDCDVLSYLGIAVLFIQIAVTLLLRPYHTSRDMWINVACLCGDTAGLLLHELAPDDNDSAAGLIAFSVSLVTVFQFFANGLKILKKMLDVCLSGVRGVRLEQKKMEEEELESQLGQPLQPTATLVLDATFDMFGTSRNGVKHKHESELL